MTNVAHHAKKVARKVPRWTAKWLPGIIVAYIIVAILSYLTNPFVKYTLVHVPFQTVVQDNGQISVVKEGNLVLRSSQFYRIFTFLKSSYHIVGNVYSGNKRAKDDTLKEIINDIHKLRFDPTEPYLISGDHFSILYIRSLGIFYATLLDPRTALDDQDWLNRQKIYLQTTVYALEVFRDAPELSTTIVPVGETSVSLMNIYSKPSDSLYSLLYALDVMKSPTSLENTYPMIVANTRQLQTTEASKQLLIDYAPSLQRHYLNYQKLLDPKTGLIRKNILLSGAKDIAKRQSAFYDNVIFWKTEQLAQKLGLVPRNQQKLDALKQRIIAAYWKPEMGCFVEDQSSEALANKYYSSDWMIVLSTGFLDPFIQSDRQYYEGCMNYIQNNKLNQPFGLRYQQQLRPWRLYPVVRFGAPEYGSTTIWSNWGMEYTKTLILLYRATGEQKYLDEAKRQIDAYSDKIIEYRCYPELYDSQGRMFKNLFYKSVCQTGWVVTYEQAKAMLDALSETPLKR